MKTCSRCREAKPTDQFYRDRRASDGLNSHCKTCHVSATQAYKRVDPARRKAQDDSWRAKNPERVDAARDRYAERNPLFHTAVIQNWRAKHPERAKAHYAINRAVRSCLIAPPDACSTCATAGPVEAHHPDYSQPLEVKWLCRKCHASMGKH